MFTDLVVGDLGEVACAVVAIVGSLTQHYYLVKHLFLSHFIVLAEFILVIEFLVKFFPDGRYPRQFFLGA